jgi:uncharacterized repeat protein (TIGR01451 family)
MSSNLSKWKSIGFRAAAAIIATVLFHTGLPLVWAGDSSASAEFGAGQPARYNENVNGDFLLIGNTVLKCLSSNTLCTNNGEVNDDLLMNNNDPDGAGPLFNGSSGSLTTPSGAVVDAAYLYWGGNLGAKSASSNSYYCNPTKNPASMATADRTAANSVQLAVAGGAYATVSADTVHTHPLGGLSQIPSTSESDPGRWGLVYEGVADVTASFAGVAAATATSVSVANIQAAQGNNCHAGWALALVYKFPTVNCLTGNEDGANKRNDYRNVAIYDGLLRQAQNSADTVTTLSGFITTGDPSTSSTLRLGAVAWEGDQYLTNDSLKVKASSAAGEGSLVDPAGPSGTSNFFDSGKQPIADHNIDLDVDPDSGAVIQQGFVNGRNDGHGVDAKTQTTSVPGGTSSIDVRFETTGDNYYPGGFALSSPITCLLAMEKDQAVNGVPVARDNSTNPNPAVIGGDEITYRVPARAVGDVQLTGVLMSDVIPAGTTYVAGSGKWGVGNTALIASSVPNNASFAGNTVSSNVGALDPLTGGVCAPGETCYAELQFKVTVNPGQAAGSILTNQAQADFSASGVSNIKENSNEVTNKIGALLSVTKNVVNPAPGDSGSFNFAVACNGSPLPDSPFSLTNGQTNTLTVPPGSNCSVTETTNSFYQVVVTGDITSNGGSVLMDANKSATFTNTRQYGSINVVKVVRGVTGDPVSAPSFKFTVACPAVAGYPQELTIGGGGGNVSTPENIPFGANCTVTEASNPGWSSTPTVSINPVDATAETAEFTNTRQTGSLTITKTTAGGNGTFSFAVDCDGTAFDSNRSVTTVSNSGSVTISGIPSGINCTVSETVPLGWDLTTPNDVQVTIPANSTVTANFTNTRQTADLVITKAVSGAYAVGVSGTFDFVVNCGDAGTFNPSIQASSTQNGTATVSGIPVGSTCQLTETVPSGWVLDTAVPGNTNPRSLTIQQTGNNTTFTNSREVGDLTISKSIDQGSGSFVFAATCDQSPVVGSPFTISIAEPATSGSVVIPGVPTGSSCVIDEQPDGSTDGSFEQIIPANGAAVTISPTGASNRAEFVNKRRTGALVISKVFPAGSLGEPDKEFQFSWDCGPEPRTISLKAGQSHRVEALPTGTQCAVVEAAAPGYVTTMDPISGTVQIREGDNTVTVTNTRSTGTLQLVKQLVPANDPGLFDLSILGTFTQGPFGNNGKTDAAVLPIGSYVISEQAAASSPTTLADYDTSLLCLDKGTPVTVGADGAVPVAANSEVICTYTNKRKATVQITKALSPADDPGVFTLTLDGVGKATGGNGATTGTLVIPTGAHTVGETAGNADTNLSDYNSFTSCATNGGAPVLGGGFTAEYGDTVLCTVSNTRKSADLSITKTAVTPWVEPGGVATFTLTVSNAAGAGTARQVQVLDPLPAGTTYLSSQGDICDPVGTTCEIGTLAAGASRTFTITYSVNSPTDALVVHNEATVTSPDDLESPGAEADVPIARIGVVKTAVETWFNAVGSTINYSYAVTNLGGIDLTGVTVSDNKISSALIDCNGGTAGNGQPLELAIGQTINCVASTTVDAGDVAAGRVDNVATADSDQTFPAADTWTVPLAALEVTKTLDSAGPFKLDDTLEYTIVVRNTGQIALSELTIVDPAADGFDPSTDCTPSLPLAALAIGASVTCDAVHVVTQDDVDAGFFTNVATADSLQTPPDSDEVTTNFDRTPALDLVKTVTSAGPYELDDTVTYSLVATNTGNVTLKKVLITESTGAVVTTCTPTGGGESAGDTGVTLKPGTKLTCTATYKIQQADVDAGFHDNTATADSEQTEEVTDDETVVVAQNPALQVTKSVADSPTPPTDGYRLGETVTYLITVKNTGTVTLTGVRVSDAGVGAVLGECTRTLPATLAPNATLSCAATHVVTQADVDAGTYTNVATATSNQTPPDTDNETVPLVQEPALEIIKTVTSVGPYALGDAITFSVITENTGTTTLTGVTVSEVNTDATLQDCSPEPPASLAPGEKITCTATHVVTQADFDAGQYRNVVVADSNETDPEEDDEIVPTPDPAVDLAVTKSIVGTLTAGQSGTYQLLVSNNGPATATSIVLTDAVPAALSLVSASGTDWDCSISGNSLRCVSRVELAAGASLPVVNVIVDVPSTATGSVTNTAVVSGSQPDRDPSNNQDSVTSTLAAVAGIVEFAPVTTTVREVIPVQAEVQGATATRQSLPRTGGDLVLGGFGALLLAAGMLTHFATRRRNGVSA